jgi:hypothetical protein
MTRDEAAAALNGNQYREEGSNELFQAMKRAGLVAIFGASDDLMEIRGAVYDEIGCYDGEAALFTREGLLKSACEDNECPYFAKQQESATAIEAMWDDGSGYSWRYDTVIPHAKFVIKEDDDNYCEGIVFALADVPAKAAE